jgi:hypothetical protein
MLSPWYYATLLAFEAQDVMRLRTMKIVGGGSDAFSEVHLMITEKFGAAVEALCSLMFGGTPLSVIEGIASTLRRTPTALPARRPRRLRRNRTVIIGP